VITPTILDVFGIFYVCLGVNGNAATRIAISTKYLQPSFCAKNN